MIIRYLAFGLVALSLSVSTAWSGRPWKINPLPGEGSFEVIDGPRPDNRRPWCEAGDHALRKLRASGTTRIYLIHPNGPAKTQSRGRGTGFTINPSKEILKKATRSGEGGNYSVSIRKVGFNMSVNNARGLCGFVPTR